MSMLIQGLMFGNDLAYADLSAKQYYGVKVTANGIELAGDGEGGDGVLQNKPKAGYPASLMLTGITPAIAGAAIAKGAEISTDANGKFITATSTDQIIGKAFEAASADGAEFSLLLKPKGVAAT